MTYGNFAWKDVMDRSANASKRHERTPSAAFVAGEPVPFMDAGDEDWAWTVSRAYRRQLATPRLDFVVSAWSYAGHRYALDDLAKPVMDVVAKNARTAWVTAHVGDRPGVRIADTAPPFPPRIDRVLEVPIFPTRENVQKLTSELSTAKVLLGEAPVGAHINVGPSDPANFGFGGAPRLVLDALSKPLGGDLSQPGDLRIRDLRVVRSSSRSEGTEIRLWVID